MYRFGLAYWYCNRSQGTNTVNAHATEQPSIQRSQKYTHPPTPTVGLFPG